MAGPCEPGDVLGVVDGDFASSAPTSTTVAREVLDRLLGGGGELVTLVVRRSRGGPGLRRRRRRRSSTTAPERRGRRRRRRPGPTRCSSAWSEWR